MREKYRARKVFQEHDVKNIKVKVKVGGGGFDRSGSLLSDRAKRN